MSGVKRRSKYRKGVRKELLEELPEPGEGELVAVVRATKGRNLLEVETSESEVALCLLPTRYRKMVWVKKGTFVIVSEANTGSKGAVSFHVEHVLYEDQIKHLQKQKLWPSKFADAEAAKPAGAAGREESKGGDSGALSGVALPKMSTAPPGYETETDSDNDDDLFVNTNHVRPDDSDDDSDDYSDDDSDDDV